MAPIEAPLVVGLGEALFDCFPDRQRLGGAPVNLAVHADALLRPLGGRALPVTRVGDDELGRRFLRELEKRGVDASSVQIDPQRPTGTVEVEPLATGEVAYRFADDVAWDCLEWTRDWSVLSGGGCDAVCFGTLAQRSAESRVTIERFLEESADAVRLFDANLRQDFYSRSVLDRSFRLASSAKLNQDEFATVCRLLGVAEAEVGESWACGALVAEYELDWIAITRGARGASLFADNRMHDAPAAGRQPTTGANSVGAGDAFAAGLLAGALRGWPPVRSLAFANGLGAFVASQPGATPTLPAELLDRWIDP